jgi:hypothetical protein
MRPVDGGARRCAFHLDLGRAFRAGKCARITFRKSTHRPKRVAIRRPQYLWPHGIFGKVVRQAVLSEPVSVVGFPDTPRFTAKNGSDQRNTRMPVAQNIRKSAAWRGFP